MKKILLLALAVLLTGVAGIEKVAAQRVELGVRVGITSNDLSLTSGDFINTAIDTEIPGFEPGSNIDRFSTDTRIGFHAALVSRIRLVEIGRSIVGLGLFLQPELVYTQNKFKIQKLDKNGHPEGKSSSMTMQSVEVPLMLSLKVSIVRVQAGPVFNAVYKNTEESGDIGIVPIKPTIGYTAGISVDIIGGLVIDGRYNGQFKQFKNRIQAGETVYSSVRASLSSWSLGLSWLF